MADDFLGSDVGFLFFNFSANAPVLRADEIACRIITERIMNQVLFETAFDQDIGRAFETARMDAAPNDPPDLNFNNDVPNFAETADFFVL